MERVRSDSVCVRCPHDFQRDQIIAVRKRGHTRIHARTCLIHRGVRVGQHMRVLLSRWELLVFCAGTNVDVLLLPSVDELLLMCVGGLFLTMSVDLC
eukprot:3913337-Rhodomonas_salina.4